MTESKTLIAVSTLATLLCGFPMDARAEHGQNICRATTRQLARACRLESAEDRKVAAAICLNFSEQEDRAECRLEAEEALVEARNECMAQRRARNELCRVPGFRGPYDPEIDPDDFVRGIDNPYAPFAIGSRWVYEKWNEEGFEVIEIEVLDETKEILGVECTVVRDTVYVDGVLVEDTFDWLAQDLDGNVWYFGELAQNFEDGVISDLDGSWEAGVDGAKPGFWVKAAPEAGEFYRQEWLPDEAEDVVEVVDLDADVSSRWLGCGDRVLQTRDFTPLEPGAEEFKYYIGGIGLILEVDPETGDRLDLVEYTP